MVRYGGLVQNYMGLNLNHRLCGLLMVWEIAENSFDSVSLMSRMVVVHLLGVRKSVDDQLCLILCVKLVVMRFGPQFLWLPIGYRWSLSHQDGQKTVLGFFLTGVSTQSKGVLAHFAWQFLSAASYFGVPMVLLTMSFWAEPKYFPQLKQSGTYVLKDCRLFELSVN